MISFYTSKQSTASSNQINRLETTVGKSINKLSTGKRYVDNVEDPAAVAVSLKMNGAINRNDKISQNMMNALSLAEVQDGTLETASQILDRMAVLRTYFDGPTVNSGDQGNYSVEFEALADELGKLLDTKFNGIKVFSPVTPKDSLVYSAESSQSHVTLTHNALYSKDVAKIVNIGGAAAFGFDSGLKDAYLNFGNFADGFNTQFSINGHIAEGDVYTMRVRGFFEGQLVDETISHTVTENEEKETTRLVDTLVGLINNHKVVGPHLTATSTGSKSASIVAKVEGTAYLTTISSPGTGASFTSTNLNANKAGATLKQKDQLSISLDTVTGGNQPGDPATHKGLVAPGDTFKVRLSSVDTNDKFSLNINGTGLTANAAGSETYAGVAGLFTNVVNTAGQPVSATDSTGLLGTAFGYDQAGIIGSNVPLGHDVVVLKSTISEGTFKADSFSSLNEATNGIKIVKADQIVAVDSETHTFNNGENLSIVIQGVKVSTTVNTITAGMNQVQREYEAHKALATAINTSKNSIWGGAATGNFAANASATYTNGVLTESTLYVTRSVTGSNSAFTLSSVQREIPTNTPTIQTIANPAVGINQQNRVTFSNTGIQSGDSFLTEIDGVSVTTNTLTGTETADNIATLMANAINTNATLSSKVTATADGGGTGRITITAKTADTAGAFTINKVHSQTKGATIYQETLVGFTGKLLTTTVATDANEEDKPIDSLVSAINADATIGGFLTASTGGVGQFNLEADFANRGYNLNLYNAGVDSVGNSSTSYKYEAPNILAAIEQVANMRATVGSQISNLRYALEENSKLNTNLHRSHGKMEDLDYAKEVSFFTRQKILLKSTTSYHAQANSLNIDSIKLLLNLN
jgi:flagellin